jgi:hypothetical protein
MPITPKWGSFLHAGSQADGKDESVSPMATSIITLLNMSTPSSYRRHWRIDHVPQKVAESLFPPTRVKTAVQARSNSDPANDLELAVEEI